MPLTTPPRRRQIRWKNLGYKTVTSGLVLMTLWGGYLYSLRVYNYFQRKKQLAATNLAIADADMNQQAAAVADPGITESKQVS